MPPFAHLHVVDLYGKFQDYQISERAIFSIGSDNTLENSGIHLPGPNIAPFHLELDCNTDPATIMAWSFLGQPSLNNQFLPPNIRVALDSGSIIRLAGYELRYFETSGSSAAIADSKTYRIEGTPRSPDFPPELDAGIEYILATLEGVPEATNTLKISPGQVVEFQVTIFNKGPQFAEFQVAIEGISPTWYEMPDQIKIHPDQPTIRSIPIAISPPREPESLAGSYRINIRVTSPNNYPGHAAECWLMLEVLPYYAHDIGGLNPKRRTIGWWFRRAGTFEFGLVNKGNSRADFRLEGQDHEDSCTFKFEDQLSFEEITWDQPLLISARGQDEANEKHSVTVHVTPQSRPIFLRAKHYPFTLAVTALLGGQELTTLSGRLTHKPLIGWFPVILVILILFFSCGFFALNPNYYIWHFRVDNQVNVVRTTAGQELLADWVASPLFIGSLRLRPGNDLIVEKPVGSMVVTVEKDTEGYVLEAESYLAFLFPGLRATRVVPVDVDPLIPKFKVSPSSTEISSGDTLTMNIKSENVEAMVAELDGMVVPLPTESFNGELVLTPDHNQTIRIEGQNDGVVVAEEIGVIVNTATPTPTPTPLVEKFEFSGNQVIAGEPVVASWSVTTGDAVVLNPLGDMPAQGSLSLTPQESTVYTLMTINPQGTPTVLGVQEVIVDQPTPTLTATPVPLAPTIVEFNASKYLVELGGNDDDDGGDPFITLFWTVEGEVTDIHLLNKDGITLETNLPPVGQMDMLIQEGGDLFILKAFNQNKSSQKNVQLVVQQAPTIISFRAEYLDAANNVQGSCATSDKNINDRRECIVTQIPTDTIKIELSWSVVNATRVQLEDRANGTSEDYGLEDSKTISWDNTANRKNGFDLIVQGDFSETKRKIELCNTSC